MLDSPQASVAAEADAIDDMLSSLLNQSDLDLFVKAQTIVLLTTQLRHTYRNRRRIVKLLPTIKRLMAGPASSQLGAVYPVGSTAGNVPSSTDRLHPYMLRVLSQFVSTWYCLPLAHTTVYSDC
jgi:hypothetical protein